MSATYMSREVRVQLYLGLYVLVDVCCSCWVCPSTFRSPRKLGLHTTQYWKKSLLSGVFDITIDVRKSISFGMLGWTTCAHCAYKWDR